MSVRVTVSADGQATAVCMRIAAQAAWAALKP